MADKLVIGCGYLGSVVAARWRKSGQRVYATTRSPLKAEEFPALGLEPILCDVLRPDSLRALPSSVDALMYSVGFDRSTGDSMRTVYVEGLANILEALEGWTGRFIHVSSTGVYGQTDGEEVDEQSATQPEEESGRVILEAEQLLRERRSTAIVLRFAGIYGPGRLIRAKEVRSGASLVGDAEKWLNLIHVEDGATVAIAASECGRPGTVYNVSDDRPVRRRDFYTHLAKVLGAPEPRFTAPPSGVTPPHERANRRILNRRMKAELGVRLRYPSFAEGLLPDSRPANSSSPARPVTDE